jgi:hypothetical protein
MLLFFVNFVLHVRHISKIYNEPVGGVYVIYGFPRITDIYQHT